MELEDTKRTITNLERYFDSDVVVYFLADRPNAFPAEIGEDAVRPLYDHILSLHSSTPKRNKVSIFLYSRGGAVEVPWRIVSMIRDTYREFNVIIPYKAHSAATMITLGADGIVVGCKGEMGPIDPSIGIKQSGEKTGFEQRINVEDVMSYISFLKEKGGLSDQTALSSAMGTLANKLDPWLIGGIYRIKEHINLVARRLLSSRKVKLEESKINSIIETLVEKTYFHGHAINRNEAREIGLPIIIPTKEQEKVIWQLFTQYEKYFKLREPLDMQYLVEKYNGEYSEDPFSVGCIQSRNLTHLFTGTLKVKARREQPPQLNININMNLQLPPNVQPEQINKDLANQFVGHLQVLLTEEVKKQVQSQSRISGIEARFERARWIELIQPNPDVPPIQHAIGPTMQS